MAMKTFFICCLLLLSKVSMAQNTFQKSIEPYLDTTLLRCSPDGNSVYLVGQIRTNGNLHVHYLKLDSNGKQLWHKEYTDLYSNYQLLSCALLKDGFLVLLGDGLASILLKINLNDGSTNWIKYYGKKEKIQLYNVAVDGYQQIWISGLHLQETKSDSNYYFQIKADKDANPIESVQARTQYSSLYYKDVQYFKPSKAFWLPSMKSMVSFADYTAPFTKRTYFLEYNKSRELVFATQKMEYITQDLNSDFVDVVTAKNTVLFSGTFLGDVNPFIPKPHQYLYGTMDSIAFNYLIINGSDSPMTPLHSYDGSIVFYSQKYRTLTKFDQNMNEIWTRKYDNCINTRAFVGEIAIDGSIYTVRNMVGKTVVSRINADGKLSACVDYTANVEPFVKEVAFPGHTYESCNCLPYTFPFTKDTLINVVSKTTTPTDICIKLDASFKVLDTVCVGKKIDIVDTDSASYFIHKWKFQAQYQYIYNPSFLLNDLGQKKIFHEVTLKTCIDTASRNVFVIPPPTITFNDTVVCAQKSVNINLTTKYAQSYLLNDVQVSPLINIQKNGLYNLKINTKGCSVEKKVNIKLVDFEPPTFKQDSLTCIGNPYPIIMDKRFMNVYWDMKKISTDTFWIKDSGLHSYKATFASDTICKITGNLSINRKDCEDIFVPNAFSPNGDLINDEFRGFSLPNKKIIELSVYDRWGSLVFRGFDPTSAWNGTFRGEQCSQGVYTYMITYLDLKTMKSQSSSGSVTLVR